MDRVDLVDPGDRPEHRSTDLMSLSFPRLAAAVSLGIGGALTALTAFGLIVADVVIRSDRFDVTPADATALARMTLGAPVVAAFGAAAVITALALLAGARRSRPIGLAVSGIGIAIGVGLIALLLLAQGPFAVLPSDRALDGIEILGSFAVFNLVAFIALVVDRPKPVVTSVDGAV
jgi:hypothetical protein